MRKLFLLIVTFFSLQIIQAQSEISSIEKILKNYMDGSSYNKLDVLESVYTENATLFLSGNGDFKRYSPKEYVAFFKNKKYGEFNGRYAKVLAIDIVKDIATAKIEIAIPARRWVYIDLFLLKKFKNGWKVISKTATRIDDEK